jgi:hypothetical protein
MKPMTISFRSVAGASMFPAAGAGVEPARLAAVSIYDKVARVAGDEATGRVCGQAGSIVLACATGQSATAISNAGDTAQRTLRRSTRRIPRRPLVVCGAEAPEASLPNRAGRSLLICIRSLCGTKPEGFRHRAYIIAPAACGCREIFCGILVPDGRVAFHFGKRRRPDPLFVHISVLRIVEWCCQAA